MHNELQKTLGKAKTNEANRIDKIPNEIMKNNISTELLGSGPYAAYKQYIVLVLSYIHDCKRKYSVVTLDIKLQALDGVDKK